MGAIHNKKTYRVAVLSLAVIALMGAILAWLLPDSSPLDENPTLLRVGVLPDENPDVLRQRYRPLVDYLSTRLSTEVRLIVPADYHDAVRLFSENKIDLAYFGGLTFVQAQSYYGAIPLVMREIDTRFTSWFLVKPERAQLELSEFKDKKMSFGSKLSTSGHLMPRHFLRQNWAIEPEAFFSQVSYSGAHDKTVLMVRDGQVELGVANSSIVKKMIVDGRLHNDDLHLLWQTPPYPDYVWAVQNTMGEAMKIQLRDAFLDLDSFNPEDGEILAGLGATAFLPADPGEFENLHEIAASLDLLNWQSK